ncbi:hypothetical protein M2347_002019 [Chryseobacterium sp. H1D6B]|uniref:hypothetical protein n=1 Tax=Chryseobacterium sp. H1D6B TaxID=2940588 RepID=UPI0015C9188C|nr:hypothetical protein [Chryseobacterium sp. H1D6B]MDH6252292.1 hypothetical protein [Chryseobacterium sp. H1D6B]
MKKLLFLFLMMCLLSCSNNDDIQDIQTVQNTADLEPDRIWVSLAEWPNNVGFNNGPLEYKFTYENGNLKKMSGQLVEAYPGTLLFIKDYYWDLSYIGNKITLKNYTDKKINELIYTIENGRPLKAEMYNDLDELVFTKEYTYEPNKIKVYINQADIRETYITYYFDSNKNLIKSEKLEKISGIDQKLTITNYSDFDTAKNPYKKLYLLNDTFYEKSLSANNYRKAEGTTELLNSSHPFPSGTFMYSQTYIYDANGQIFLHHPF